jgi:hypothetical protein
MTYHDFDSAAIVDQMKERTSPGCDNILCPCWPTLGVDPTPVGHLSLQSFGAGVGKHKGGFQVTVIQSVWMHYVTYWHSQI